MSLRVLNNESGFAAQQAEDKSFSKICFIPSLKLSCFGCCGHHFKDQKRMERFFDSNKKELQRYLQAGKTHKEFMEREHLVDSCGGCYSLIRKTGPHGEDQYVCGVHPLQIGEPDIRIGYCDHDYLCHTAAHVNKMTADEKQLFYEFLTEQQFTAYEYSMINAQETVLLEKYRDWVKKRENIKKTQHISPL